MGDPVREETGGGQRITRDSLHFIDPIAWRDYRKVPTTRATRFTGPFEVETREGVLRCPDGYLAIDAHGWPYPIARDEFEAIYERASASSSKDEGGDAEFGEGDHLLKLSLDADRLVSELICVGRCVPADDDPTTPCWLRTWAEADDVTSYVDDLHELGVWRISATFDGDCTSVSLHEQQPPAPSVSQQGTGELDDDAVHRAAMAYEIGGSCGSSKSCGYDCANGHEHRMRLALAAASQQKGGDRG